ncbi:MAG: Iron-sulfur cluster-binding protein [uncultured Chloroflexi bacterium]|uniref:Iron-sulfur cluster-binding protein n=1 Tax=uncultured Chloroflexota bacterium TaxID=166587 RepID=A0A6J4JKL5_9CHLR|nr:MAG: Iron-sulfur cluster-binding protein [uncultured Chloroflexota bacterium]
MVFDVDLPRVARIRQRFPAEHITDVRAAVREAILGSDARVCVRPGARLALTAGSRGITQIPEILAACVATLRELGAEPFIVPAMGSHGGATAEGQREVLEGYGITEERTGAPIRATMEVVEVGRTPLGVPVYMDRNAFEADGVVVCGRVKAHTAFKAPIESGLCKMLAVGLGKQRGAETMHNAGLATTIPEAARVSIAAGKVSLGLAIVENAADEPFHVRAVAPEQFHAADEELLRLSNGLLPRIPFEQLDVLVVDWIGKNISGSGMDPNVIGMWRRLGGERKPDYRRIVVRDVTPESHGNALGVGWADFTTRRLVEQIDYQAMLMNSVTANAPDVARVPLALPADREAIQVAIKTSAATGPVRLARVHSTLRLEELYVSEALLDEVRANPQLEVLEDPAPLAFDGSGGLGPQFVVK